MFGTDDEKSQGFTVFNKIKAFVSKLKTTQIIVYGFLIVILIGAFLLSLPIASNDGKSIGFLNAFFTSTSAVCVTGLVVVNTLEHWTLFGKVVILFLIQIGGLGFMSLFTTAIIFTGRKITLRERLVIQQSLNQDDLTGMVRLARNVVLLTFVFEFIAAVILFLKFFFTYDMPFKAAVFNGVFHSISAFCNAGFDVLSDSSLMPYVHDTIISITIMLLIILGGLGFTVWLDLLKTISSSKKDINFSLHSFWGRLSLHSRLVLEVSAFLIALGTVFFFAAEFNNELTLAPLNLFDKFIAALFQSVTPRTAGFNSISQSGLMPESQLMTIILMFVGGSPGGTAGGVKTVTFSIILLSVVSVVNGKNSIEIHKRSLPLSILQKSLAVVIMNLTVIIAATMILSITEAHTAFDGTLTDYLFEAASAVGTVGLTLGLTPYLSVMGKIVICICMFIGRLGPITVAVGLSIKQLTADKSILYPEEKVFVG